MTLHERSDFSDFLFSCHDPSDCVTEQAQDHAHREEIRLTLASKRASLCSLEHGRIATMPPCP